MNAFISGFLLSLSLIAAIGAQNAFVLRCGLQRQHVFAVSLTCAASDAILISAGVAGFGALIAAVPWLELLMTMLGGAFLIIYAARSFWAALINSASLKPASQQTLSLTSTVGTCLAFTWLNPHVYLDTVVLLGSISSHYGPQRFAFGLGASLASLLFFFALGFGARFLAPLFVKPIAWRILDFFIGLVMTAIALKLLLPLLP